MAPATGRGGDRMTASTDIARRHRLPRLTIGRALLGILALMMALGAAGWYARAPVLRTAADLWIVSDPVGPADAVAVFGGGIEDRPFAAAEYYHRGLVKKVLVSNVRESPTAVLGVLLPHAAANRAVLLKLGVPEEAIETFGTDLSNTHQEALALRNWAVRTGAHSIIVPTDIFAARRLRWTLHSVFGDAIVIRVPALDPPEYRDNNWWHDEKGVVAFQNEVLKYVYYRWKY
jgi:uncharacterized SAM-binding protein YcdF (DUF218 family)